jgi:LSD1 subclass zinc finger protein
VAHLQCSGCRTWLMYSYGARSVKCAVCDTINKHINGGDSGAPHTHTPPAMFQPAGVNGVQPGATPVTNGVNGAAGMGADGAHAFAPPGHANAAGAAVKKEPEAPPVVVQNPATLDDKGNPVCPLHPCLCCCLQPSVWWIVLQ